jgi:hypothetical protein
MDTQKIKLYCISNITFSFFYTPEISCADSYISELPYIFEDGYWLYCSLETAKREYPEIKWEIIAVNLEKA